MPRSCSAAPAFIPPEAERQLVQRLQAREQMALTEFEAHYQPRLYHLIRRLMPSDEAAEDVWQESLLKIWYAFARYDPQRGSLYSWAASICCHQALDHLRTARRQGAGRTLPLDQASAVRQRAGPAFVPEHLDVRASLLSLRPCYRQVLELQYFQGFTQQEIAQQLALPLGTVKTHCRQALRHLARLYYVPPPNASPPSRPPRKW